MPGGGRTYGIYIMYRPRAPISIYTGGGGTPGLDVKTARKRSLPIDLVYTYISPKLRCVFQIAFSYIYPRDMKFFF